MAYEKPITVKESIDNIYRKKYLLPAIQREFVWDTEQIERLFDSLMRNYPIGSFLFWYVEKEKSKNFQFYEFIRKYHERNSRYNPKANISGEEAITAILDGQQRLTALYIGLKGTYAYKLPRKKWDNDEAFPERRLYINLLSESKETDMLYDFCFLTSDESENRDKDTYWFKVGDILDIKEEYQVNDYLIANDLLQCGKEKSQFANKTLFKLHAIVHRDEVINYFLEKDEKLDKVLNIFIRVNSGGTILSYSDLLLSIATAQWKNRDAREEINNFVEEINSIGDGFNFNKDFVLKGCLVLSDFSDIAFKVDNFNKKNMLTIENNWDDITEAIKSATILVTSFGFNRDTLASNNAMIPISYYFMKKGSLPNFSSSNKYENDREKIHKWLICSLLKRAFSGQPDNVLRPIRQIIAKNNSSFPLDNIADKFKGESKSLIFDNDEIENLFYYQYGKGYTFPTLALLYPTLDFRNKFHIDHIYPKSYFTRRKLSKKGIDEKKIDFYLENYNCLANLQLLEGTPNREKSSMDFERWLKSNYKDLKRRSEYMERNYIPDIDLEFDNFKNFIIERKKLMTKKFNKILKF